MHILSYKLNKPNVIFKLWSIIKKVLNGEICKKIWFEISLNIPVMIDHKKYAITSIYSRLIYNL